jgi:hypothetical protein
VNELLLEFLVADAEIDVLQTSTRTFPAKRPFGREGVAT